jgi:hypothetical protein
LTGGVEAVGHMDQALDPFQKDNWVPSGKANGREFRSYLYQQQSMKSLGIILYRSLALNLSLMHCTELVHTPFAAP